MAKKSINVDNFGFILFSFLTLDGKSLVLRKSRVINVDSKMEDTHITMV
jgi:hypothetical protein